MGEQLAGFYLWKHMLWNFMLIGASGTILNYALYEWVFRALFLYLWGGTFIAWIMATFLVAFWNYYLNKRWSLKPDAQILKMKKAELLDLKAKVEGLLSGKFDRKGKRI